MSKESALPSVSEIALDWGVLYLESGNINNPVLSALKDAMVQARNETLRLASQEADSELIYDSDDDLRGS